MKTARAVLFVIAAAFLGEGEIAGAATVTATYNAPTDVPVTAASYIAANNSVALSLNFAPEAGTELTVVKNTGLAFIGGTFSNLAQGEVITLTYNGTPYVFVANYYGGTGNDLVLSWGNRRIFAWGSNYSGVYGADYPPVRGLPTPMLSTGALLGKTVLSVATGGSHSLAVCSDGTVASWGDNYYGQLGDRTRAYYAAPGLVRTENTYLAGRRVVAVAAGYTNSLALCSDGTVAMWGADRSKQVPGYPPPANDVPAAVPAGSTSALFGKSVVAIAGGGGHNLALCSDGSLAAWGNNSSGELGNGTSGSYLANPVAVLTANSALQGKTVVAIATGTAHTLALCSDGTVAAWGYNGFGQLGDNSTVSQNRPVAVNTTAGLSALAGRSVVSIAAGHDHSYALCSDGSVVAWGRNISGELGETVPSPRAVPVAVNTGAGSALAGRPVVVISAGYYFGLALGADGVAASWGTNAYGELGDKTTTSHPIPGVVTTSQFVAGERLLSVVTGAYSSFSLGLVASRPSAPAARPNPASEVAQTSVILNFLVNGNGSAPNLVFQYSLDPSMTSGVVSLSPKGKNPPSALGATVQCGLSGLTGHTTYYYRVRATNAFGTTDSAIASFTTLNSAPPAPAQEVTATTGDQTTVNLALPAQDADGDPVILYATLQAQNLTVDRIAGNSVTFTHTGTGIAEGSFDYAVHDAHGDFAIGHVRVLFSDNDAPRTTITSSPPALTNQTAARIVFSATDNTAVTSYEASLDDSAYTVVTSPLNLSGLAEGRHTLCVRATDTAGNLEAKPAAVEWLVDLSPPVITSISADLTVEAAGLAGSLVTYKAATASDAVKGTAITYSHASNTVFPLGVTTVTVTATDDAGNQRRGFFTVNVRDSTLPLVDGHEGVTVEATSPAGAIVEYAPASATDNLTGSPTITYSQESGTRFPVGLTSVVIYATDEAGNTGSSAFWVNVVDTTPPVVAPHARVLMEATSKAGALVHYVAGAASDAVTLKPEITYSQLSGTVFPVGDTVVKITARDAAGNLGYGTFIVSVTAEKVDKKAPIVAFSAPASNSVKGTFTLTGTVQENIALKSLRLFRNGALLALDAAPVFTADQKMKWSASGIVPENGTETFLIEAVDFAGLVSTARKTITFTNTRPELAGTYNALLVPTGARTLETTALVSVSVMASGSFSGKYCLSKTTLPFTGVLLNDGTARFNPNQTPQLDLLDKVNGYFGALGFSISEQDGLTGTLTTQTGGAPLANFAALRTVRGADAATLRITASAAPGKGIYSVVFPAGATTPGAPQGDGYASLTLLPSGSVLLTGYLADGTRYTAAGVLRLDHTVPLFNSFYDKRGVFAGTLAFEDLADSDVTGPDFVWFRPPASGQTFAAGWPGGVALGAVGTKYAAPAALDFGQGIPDVVRGNSALVFSDALLPATIISPVSVAPATGAVKLISAALNPATLVLTPTNGLFSGTVTHGGVTDKFGGILLQKGANRGGFGYFLTTPRIVGTGTQSGGVSLQARVEE